jgi:hypothetical protein
MECNWTNGRRHWWRCSAGFRQTRLLNSRLWPSDWPGSRGTVESIGPTRGPTKICRISGLLPCGGLKLRSQRTRIEAGRCRGWRACWRPGNQSPSGGSNCQRHLSCGTPRRSCRYSYDKGSESYCVHRLRSHGLASGRSSHTDLHLLPVPATEMADDRQLRAVRCQHAFAI